MKGKKCLLWGTAGIVFALVGIISCTPELHEHSYSKEWTSDEFYHWHTSSCGHEDEVSWLAPHVSDSGEMITAKLLETGREYKCAVCGRVLKTEKGDGGEKPGEVEKPTPGEELENFEEVDVYKFHDCVQKGGVLERDGQTFNVVVFGDWPQSFKKENVNVDRSKGVVMGMNTYYLGDDDCLYAEHEYWGEMEYFKVEPIEWLVLDEDYHGTGRALICTAKALVGGIPFYEDALNDRIIDGKVVHPNDYEYSQVRAYLNGYSYPFTTGTKNKWKGRGFLNTAFTASGIEKIAVTEVEIDEKGRIDDGSGDITMAEYGYRIVKTVEDKVFCLSENPEELNGYDLYIDRSCFTDYIGACGTDEKDFLLPWVRTSKSDNPSVVFEPFVDMSQNAGYDSSRYVYVLPAMTIEI